MSKEQIKQIIDSLIAEWQPPKTLSRILAANPESIALTQCTAEIADEAIDDPLLPPEITEFWNLYRHVGLFIEIESCLWGLELFGCAESKEQTKEFRTEPYSQYQVGDVVIGKFYCYPDRLVVRCDPQAADFGHVFSAIYDGKRDEWFFVENNFIEFLRRYAESEGERYWERRQT